MKHTKSDIQFELTINRSNQVCRRNRRNSSLSSVGLESGDLTVEHADAFMIRCSVEPIL